MGGRGGCVDWVCSRFEFGGLLFICGFVRAVMALQELVGI